MSLDILGQIDDALEANQDPADGFRSHLGFSTIGEECKRKLWYSFHWVTLRLHTARTLRIFERGKNAEPEFAALLRAAGFKFLEVDPDTGQQFRFHDKNTPCISGSVDGVLVDLLAGGQLLGAEFKTMNAANFRKLEKSDCKTAQPKHYSQQQGYIHASKNTKWELAGFLYLVQNKDNQELYSELIEEDPETAQADLEPARQIVRAKYPPDRISQSEDFFLCRFCDHVPVCHRDALAHQSCRSCEHSKAIHGSAEDWRCMRFDINLDRAAQIEGCNYWNPRKL